jgi:sugar-specific transcriptional regulator TrmB
MEQNEKPKKSLKRSLDDKIKVASNICDLYGKGAFTIASCCEECGVDWKTFYVWSVTHPEIAEIYKKAKDNHAKATKETLREKALAALDRMLNTYHVDESEVEEIFDKKNRLLNKRIKTKKKPITANVTAIIWALKNADPANWNDQLNIDLGGEVQVFKIGDQEIRF